MKHRVQNHLNQAAFLTGVAASGFVNAGFKAASASKQGMYTRQKKHRDQDKVALGRVKYRPNVKEPAELLHGIKDDLDDIKDALVDIAEKK